LSSIILARLLSSMVELSSASGLRIGTFVDISCLRNETSCPVLRRDAVFRAVRFLRVEDDLKFVDEYHNNTITIIQ
jgi:hypothetical protein